MEKERQGVRLITSDDHRGLKASLKSVFPSVSWQRCQAYLQRNAVPSVPKLDMRRGMANNIRNIFSAPDKAKAQNLLDLSVDKHKKNSLKAIRMDGNQYPRRICRIYFTEKSKGRPIVDPAFKG